MQLLNDTIVISMTPPFPTYDTVLFLPQITDSVRAFYHLLVLNTFSVSLRCLAPLRCFSLSPLLFPVRLVYQWLAVAY